MIDRIILVVGLLLLSLGSLAQEFDKDYRVLQGDYNNDGRTDFYLDKHKFTFIHGEVVTPIALSETTGDVILEQNYDKTFSLESVNNFDPSDWQESSVTAEFEDFNLDGAKDVLLQGIEAVISGALEQIIYANPQGGLPTVLQEVDDAFSQFFYDLSSWIADPNYFYQEENFLGYYCVEGQWVPVYGYYYDPYYESYVFGVIGYTIYCTEYAAAYDGSIFHPDTVKISAPLGEVLENVDLTSGSANAVEIAQILADVLGISIGDGELETSGGTLPYEDTFSFAFAPAIPVIAGTGEGVLNLATILRVLSVLSQLVSDAGLSHEMVFRVYGGCAGKWGQSWTPFLPKAIYDYRNYAGLPNCNDGSMMHRGILTDDSLVIKRPALPLDGNEGGMLEYVVPTPVDLRIRSLGVETLSPAL